MRDLKSVFYNVWEWRVREATDEGKTLLERVEEAFGETLRLMLPTTSVPQPETP
jgi:hypothetical protein